MSFVNLIFFGISFITLAIAGGSKNIRIIILEDLIKRNIPFIKWKRTYMRPIIIGES